MQLDYQKLDAIREEVSPWNRQNFGDNVSKVDPTMVLNSLCPLLGVFEEIGESAQAIEPAEFQDAYADIMIFLCDYVSREGETFADILGSVTEKQVIYDYMLRECNGALQRVQIGQGCLAHATLKRHQGIRGYDKIEQYKKKRNEGILILLLGLQELAKGHGTTIETLTDKVWQSVKLRNWKKNPVNANEVAAAVCAT